MDKFSSSAILIEGDSTIFFLTFQCTHTNRVDNLEAVHDYSFSL